MNLSEYQKEVARTCATSGNHSETVKMSLVGLADEVGEICGPLKKYLWHGHGIAGAKLLDELGDVLWYLTTIANEFGINLDDVITENVAKLRKHYPDGFSSERSINREESHG